MVYAALQAPHLLCVISKYSKGYSVLLTWFQEPTCIVFLETSSFLKSSVDKLGNEQPGYLTVVSSLLILSVSGAERRKNGALED